MRQVVQKTRMLLALKKYIRERCEVAVALSEILWFEWVLIYVGACM